VLDWSDVNTDLIIPARYLKRIERTGFGPLLFADKRYRAGMAPEADNPEAVGPAALDPSFPLNQEEAKGCDVLMVGKNFGCGSSREHAVWAVAQDGWKVLLAPGKDEGFAVIFERNALNNGLLAFEIDEDAWTRIVAAARRPGGARVEVEVDLEKKLVRLLEDSVVTCESPFDLADSDRHRLIHGLDAIGETLTFEKAITTYEASRPSWATPSV
jgi:3-isopropylmalate/(R)-2-methylmalate dehydratase small subunit